jgi:dTDP-4-dehydrorhamnose 3,5-epimerase
MLGLTKSVIVPSAGLTLEDFEPDSPFPEAVFSAKSAANDALIDGVSLLGLTPHFDPRGSLCELLSIRSGFDEPLVHVYQVTALPGSIRAWIYHRKQHDRLAFPNGRFQIVLYDIRPGSSTLNMLNVFVLGRECPSLLRIPPRVIHGVQNIAGETSTFVNLPTVAYDPTNPDKRRLPQDDPRIPFKFNDG